MTARAHVLDVGWYRDVGTGRVRRVVQVLPETVLIEEPGEKPQLQNRIIWSIDVANGRTVPCAAPILRRKAP